MIGLASTDSTTAPPSDSAGLLRRTPSLLLGPFYPLTSGQPAGSDLWADGDAPATAQRLSLGGRVFNQRGEPVAGALIELWQADERGRYRHPSAPETALVDPRFAGYGAMRTNAAGCYGFRSIVPGAYSQGDVLRAPHLHIQVTGRQDRLVTQLFLPGHPLNAGDRWYCAVANPQPLVPRGFTDRVGTLHLTADIVLCNG